MSKLVAFGIALGMVTLPLAVARAADPPPAAVTSPVPSPSATAAASAEIVECPPRTRCLTAAMMPIGTPIKVLVTGWMIGKFNEHPESGGATMLSAEDVVVNGRLIVRKGVPGRMSGAQVLAMAPPCAMMTLASMFVWSQDYQFVPVSFGDPRVGAPNTFNMPMGMSGIECRRGNVPATVYISGPPTLVMPRVPG